MRIARHIGRPAPSMLALTFRPRRPAAPAPARPRTTIPSASAMAIAAAEPLRAPPRRARARAPSPPRRAGCAPRTGARPSPRASPARRRSGAPPAPTRPGPSRASRAAATPTRCTSPPGRRRRCAPRRAPAPRTARPRARASPSRPQTSASSVIAISHLRVARERVEALRGERLELRARLVLAAQLEVQQRERAAPRGHRRVHRDEAAHGLLDLGQPALLAADVEHRLRVDVDRVLGVPALPDRERLLGEPLGLVEAPASCARAQRNSDVHHSYSGRWSAAARRDAAAIWMSAPATSPSSSRSTTVQPAPSSSSSGSPTASASRRSSDATSSRSCTVSGRQSA